MRRDPAIEFFRILIMFGIVLLHVCQQRVGAWPNNVLVSCVPGFVLISGYFGIRFSWRKLAKLYLMAVYASLIVPLVGGVWPLSAYCREVLRCWNLCLEVGQPSGFWFLHAYVFMLMFSPLVNVVVERGEQVAFLPLLPLFVLVGCWGFGKTLPLIGCVLPSTEGLDAYGGVTLLGIYAAARLCRQVNMQDRLHTKWLWIALPILWCLTGVGLGDYNSPFAFALAAVCYLLVSRVKIPRRIARIITYIAPSMFSVYLIHTNMFGFPAMRTFEEEMLSHGVPLFGAFIITGLLALTLSLCIDQVRRIALMVASACIKRIKNV